MLDQIHPAQTPFEYCEMYDRCAVCCRKNMTRFASNPRVQICENCGLGLALPFALWPIPNYEWVKNK